MGHGENSISVAFYLEHYKGTALPLALSLWEREFCSLRYRFW